MTGMIEEIRIHSQLILMAILKLHMDLLYRLETPLQMQHIQMVIVRVKIGMVIGQQEHLKVIIFGALNFLYLGQ